MALLVYQVLLLAAIQNVLVKSNFSKNGYHLVSSCPNTKTEWDARSLTLKCNITNQYHCSPFNMSQLYEFCYERGVLQVIKGHCLGIAENGNLNIDTCKFFVQGCPTEDYYSNESYKYPSCLSIHDNCYTEDCVCNCLTANKLNVTETQQKDKCTCRPKIESAPYENQKGYLIGFVICLILLIVSVAGNVVQICISLRKQSRQGYTYTNASPDEGRQLLGGQNHETQLQQRQTSGTQTTSCDEQGQNHETQLQQRHTSSTQTTGCDEQGQNNETQLQQRHTSGTQTTSCDEQGRNHETQIQQMHTSGTQTTSCDDQGRNHETQLQQRHTSGTQTTSCDEQDGIYKLTLVDYTLEDAELFILLKRQCLHQGFREFLYLVNTRVLKVDKLYIFKQRDENGCILLHYAAQGGHTVILDCIIHNAPPDILHYTCIRGQNALHFAMKGNKTDMFMHLINNYKEKLPTSGAFAPVHWVAWLGKVWLLESLEQQQFDIFIKTKNGLNILDIACMAKLSKESDKFCEDVLTKYNDPNKIDPMKTDLSGWNIAHYASMSGRDLLLKFLEEKQTLRSLITKNTKWKKTCLHIACEYANVSIVKFIVTKFPTQLNCKDHLSWSALHYAAKGGSLEILEYLIENKLEIGCLTEDRKTILHIACIHKNLDISKYAVEHLPPKLLDTATNSSGLLACHYLAVEAKKDGNEANILEVLRKSNMNLKATCRNGLTLLEWAIDHFNIDLIEVVVSVKFREKCGVDTESLEKAITRKPHQIIIPILQTALKEMNEKSK